MTTPIANAIPLARAAVYAALAPLVGTYQSLPRCYWLAAAQGAPLPLLVMQSQDGGGGDASMLNLGGWSGLITVKAIAASLAGAEALLSGVPAAMEALAAPAGYTIRATLARPLTLPPSEDVWSAGLIYSIDLFRRG